MGKKENMFLFTPSNVSPDGFSFWQGFDITQHWIFNHSIRSKNVPALQDNPWALLLIDLNINTGK